MARNRGKRARGHTRRNIPPSAPDISTQLQAIYPDPADPGSYGGIERLLRRAREKRIKGASRVAVKRFLAGQTSYTLHRQARRRFPRNPTRVAGVDDQWQADLVDMQALARDNQGMKYLLTCIDVFSKYAWVIPILEMSGTIMLKAFKELLH